MARIETHGVAELESGRVPLTLWPASNNSMMCHIVPNRPAR